MYGIYSNSTTMSNSNTVSNINLAYQHFFGPGDIPHPPAEVGKGGMGGTYPSQTVLYLFAFEV